MRRFRPACYGKAVGVAVQRAIEEITKFTNTTAHVCANRKRPKGAVFAKGELLFFCDRLKTRDVLVSRTREKEEFIEISLAGKFGFLIGQANILCELSRAQGAERYNGDTRGVAKRFECVFSGGLPASDGDARETAQADSPGGLQVEVIFRQIDGTAVFSDERFTVPGATAGFIELYTGTAANPDARNV